MNSIVDRMPSLADRVWPVGHIGPYGNGLCIVWCRAFLALTILATVCGAVDAREPLAPAAPQTPPPSDLQRESPQVAQIDWPQFRGADARGVSDDPRLAVSWSAEEAANVAWEVAIPGRGWSSPVVSGERIFLTSVIALEEGEEPRKGLYFGGERKQPPDAIHRWMVYCLDLASGTLLWEQLVAEGKPAWPVHIKNSFASETPVTDGQRLYCYFGNVGVFCFTLGGELLWERRLPPEPTRLEWGTAASPVLGADRLFVINDNERDSYLLALDKYTGEELWRVERDEKSNWSTPYLWQHEGGQELVTLGSGQVRSYDLDGELLWTLSGMSSITIATPYTYQDRLIISSGYVLDGQRPIYAIRHGGRGDLSVAEGETSNDWVVWSHPTAAPYNPSTLIYQGFLYVLYDRGLLACYRAEDGSLVYDRQRLPGRGAFTASPWGARDRVFCLNEDGETVVVPVGESFSVEAVNRLRDDDMTLATPALAGSRLLIRTLSRLYCIAADAARQRVEPRE